MRKIVVRAQNTGSEGCEDRRQLWRRGPPSANVQLDETSRCSETKGFIPRHLLCVVQEPQSTTKLHFYHARIMLLTWIRRQKRVGAEKEMFLIFPWHMVDMRDLAVGAGAVIMELEGGEEGV